jgi:multiple sugar transport system substrate-binding protein
MKKMIILCVLLATVISFTLAANGEKEVIQEGPVIITVHSWDNEYSVIDATAKFNELNKDIQVNHVISPWDTYQDKLFTSLAGGDDIDAFYIRETSVFSTYANKNMLYPLDDLIAKTGFDMSVYGGYLEQLKVNGNYYAIPYRGAGTYTFYNKDLFDAAGVAYPPENWTWEDYREITKKVTTGEGVNKVWGGLILHKLLEFNYFDALQKGMKIVNDNYSMDIDKELLKKDLMFTKNLFAVDGSHPSLAEMQALNMGLSAPFKAEQTAVAMAGEWMPGILKNAQEAGDLDFRWGLTNLPSDQEPYVSVGAATKGAVSSKAKHPEEAFTFLTFVGGPQGQKIIADSGSKPAMVTDEIKKSFTEKFNWDQKTTDIFFSDAIMTSNPMNLAAPYVSQILLEEITLYYTDSQEIEKTVDNICSRIDEALVEVR